MISRLVYSSDELAPSETPAFQNALHDVSQRPSCLGSRFASWGYRSYARAYAQEHACRSPCSAVMHATINCSTLSVGLGLLLECCHLIPAQELHSLVSKSTTAQLLETLAAPPKVVGALPAHARGHARELVAAYAKVLGGGGTMPRSQSLLHSGGAAGQVAEGNYAGQTADNSLSRVEHATHHGCQTKLLSAQVAGKV